MSGEGSPGHAPDRVSFPPPAPTQAPQITPGGRGATVSGADRHEESALFGDLSPHIGKPPGELDSRAALAALAGRWQVPDVDTFADLTDLDEHRPVTVTGTPYYDLLAGHRPAWHADAACRDHDVALFFPERGESTEPAKAICAGCPVADACAAYAAENRIGHGIWGGESARARKRPRAA